MPAQRADHPPAGQTDLFEPAVPVLPEGMAYQREFLNRGEEAALVELAAALPLREMNYTGYLARRRVASYGGRYDFAVHQLEVAEPLPHALEPLRAKVAAWLGMAPQLFVQCLVAEYRPGTPLGWHRDVPDFEDVVGVSLLGSAVMRFRPYRPGEANRKATLKLALDPRSIYLLRGPARWGWQHSVSPTKSLRYSITFRTARARD